MASSEPPGRVPTSTYRLQLTPDQGFAEVRALVDGLRRLGVGHLYLSPVLQAAPGSTHGYDTVDHGEISIDLGGRAAFDELAATVLASGGGVVIDVVPNHMSIAAPLANRWWWDVLEHGPGSRYASHFDITWESHETRQRDTVLLPVLGDHYGRVLEAGELVLDHDEHGFVVRYFDHRFPLTPDSVAEILRAEPDAASIGERLEAINADVDAVHDLLELQHYQLCHWRRARYDLDYRRFFDIDTLIGVRVEDPDVFADTHALVLELVAAGLVDGLRIDHPDGLADPAGYFDRLVDAAPGAWIVAEKILEPDEALPSWPIAGTTGYDFATVVGGVLIDPAGAAELTRWWHEHVDPDPWPDVVGQAKRQIVRGVLAADVARLADVGVRLCERHRRHRDHTRHDLTEAIRALLESFPVYRTYVHPPAPPSDRDRAVLDRATAAARTLAPHVDDDLFGFLRAVLGGDHHGAAVADEFVRRFQQLTGPAMAKSVEDTSFYRYMPMAGANEVGADPGHPARSIGAFHDHNRTVHQHWPHTMTTLSTHDTKRSADVRARLAVLTETPAEWIPFLDAWVPRLDARWRVDPHRPTSVLLLQTLVGAWPIDASRLAPYVEKATKEAKDRTSWTDADDDFDAAVAALVDDVLADRELVAAVDELVARLHTRGRAKALAQQLLQLTSPGVPDVYQGNERWDLSLVDPDNRRPVDHATRAALLDRLVSDGGPTTDLATDDAGAHKLWVTHQALALRARRPHVFGAGDAGRYEPIEAGDGAVAFVRGGEVFVAATIRHTATPVEVDLPDGRWRDLLTGDECSGRCPVDPVALLERIGS